MNLLTPRLCLRRFHPADINTTYLGWLNDPEVTRFSNQRFRQHTAESSAAYLASFDGSDNSFLLIEQLEDERPIGTTTVYRNSWHGTADIGLMVGDRRCWGQGYGREAWLAVLEAVLAEPGMRKVTGGTARPNRAMVRIMEQTGMELEAVRTRQELIEGEEVDILYYARYTESEPESLRRFQDNANLTLFQANKMQDYTRIEIKTKDVYIKQHRNYSVDKSIFMRHLAAAQDLRTYDLPQEFFRGIHVLDAGCGNTGYFQVAMKNLGVSKVTCLDIGSEWIADLQSVLVEHDCDAEFVEFVPGSTTSLPFPDNTFDFTCSNGVLMHLESVDSAETALKELVRVTRPGGYVYSHIGIDKPGVVDKYIVPALRQAYKDDADFMAFIDNLDPTEIVAELKNVYSAASAHDPRVSSMSQLLETLITLDTTTFWQNMLQVPVQQGPLLSEEWGLKAMKKIWPRKY